VTPRTTMSDLIDVLRGMTDAGTADYTVGTAIFWDGDQIQRVLDRHSLDIIDYPLTAVGHGSIVYNEYRMPFTNLEQTVGGTSVFYLSATGGSIIGTANYSVDYLNGDVDFTADTRGSTVYMTAHTYDLNAAAAEIWGMKAANVAKAFDFSTDNHSVKRSQMMKQYLDMQTFYRAQGGMQTGTMYRPDNNILEVRSFGEGDGQW
jgi:hypothetical protein